LVQTHFLRRGFTYAIQSYANSLPSFLRDRDSVRSLPQQAISQQPTAAQCDEPSDPHHNCLVQALGGAHGGLDGQGAHVLPALLEEGDEVVDGQHDVTDELVLGHADVADSDTHAENLLQLELDGGLDIGHLVGEVLSVRDGSGELSSLGQTGTQETGDLLDQGVGSHESIVLARELLDELLVLVELLQVLSGHGINTVVLGTIDIVLVTENANGHACKTVSSCYCNPWARATYGDGGRWGA
jgi:hypothetical protein